MYAKIFAEKAAGLKCIFAPILNTHTHTHKTMFLESTPAKYPVSPHRDWELGLPGLQTTGHEHDYGH